MSPPAHLGHTIRSKKNHLNKNTAQEILFVVLYFPSFLKCFPQTGIGDPSPDALKNKPPHHSVLQFMTYGFAFMYDTMDTAWEKSGAWE